ncbi:V-type ATP synthase subunit D [Peptoclostridium acidaminophilum DSM 3953]|uniref:V-type ATP synthase subunit D n=1 Tax=Peptoclostridium acidaminophilum DSM 3953 TaxID=1286171 RepID=W8T4D6_PEPAC|nr:V-type ATP synthase subunit D [Peptoclostridium acidaminophilum]AHM55660.1 V-type ATP synthase subunit D [Peptoclostridium acidaminophilum DSM 3953]
MNVQTAATKANLMRLKSSLEFSQKAFELLDKKRNVLIREMMTLVDRSKEIQAEIAIVFSDAYKALEMVNVSFGMEYVEDLALSIQKDEDYEILMKSVMGVEIPSVKYEKHPVTPNYGFFRTNPAFDIAIRNFRQVKYLIYELAQVENSVYRLAVEIKKTQRRANALENVQIPRYKAQAKYIQEVLEEKDREDFFRLKRIKGKK